MYKIIHCCNNDPFYYQTNERENVLHVFFSLQAQSPLSISPLRAAAGTHLAIAISAVETINFICSNIFSVVLPLLSKLGFLYGGGLRWRQPSFGPFTNKAPRWVCVGPH